MSMHCSCSPFTTEKLSTVCPCHCVFIHVPADRHLCCFYFGVIINTVLQLLFYMCLRTHTPFLPCGRRGGALLIVFQENLPGGVCLIDSPAAAPLDLGWVHTRPPPCIPPPELLPAKDSVQCSCRNCRTGDCFETEF